MIGSEIVYMKTGSHLYGLSTPNSDVDYKGVFIPSKRAMLLGSFPATMKWSTSERHKRNTRDDEDYEMISIHRFIELARAGDLPVMDMLHCEKPVSMNGVWMDLLDKRTMFYSKHSIQRALGYIHQQADRYGGKATRAGDVRQALESLEALPLEDRLEHYFDRLYIGKHARIFTDEHDRKFYCVAGKKIQSTMRTIVACRYIRELWDTIGERARAADQNDGVDWKAVSHALRASYQTINILALGDFSYPLIQNPFLLDVKLGKLNYREEVEPVLEECIKTIEELLLTTDLPETSDAQYWEDWLYATLNSSL